MELCWLPWPSCLERSGGPSFSLGGGWTLAYSKADHPDYPCHIWGSIIKTLSLSRSPWPGERRVLQHIECHTGHLGSQVINPSSLHCLFPGSKGSPSHIVLPPTTNVPVAPLLVTLGSACSSWPPEILKEICCWQNGLSGQF
jgi:hypothetical protein